MCPLIVSNHFFLFYLFSLVLHAFSFTSYNRSVYTQIWDTAGQERFKAMAPMFYRNANAALIIFDITSRQSFENMQDWVLELKRNVDTPMVLCVVGNKIDLGDSRAVPRNEAAQYAKGIGAAYHECSAMEDKVIIEGTVFSIQPTIMKIYEYFSFRVLG